MGALLLASLGALALGCAARADTTDPAPGPQAPAPPPPPPPPPPIPAHGFALRADNDFLKSALGLSAGQASRIRAIQEEYKGRMDAAFHQLHLDLRAPATSRQEAISQFQDNVRAITSDCLARLTAALDSAQAKKLPSVADEESGLSVGEIPEAIYPQLSLTSSQASAIAEEGRAFWQRLQPKPTDGAQPTGVSTADITAAWREAQPKVRALLTPEQNSAVDAYLAQHETPDRRFPIPMLPDPAPPAKKPEANMLE